MNAALFSGIFFGIGNAPRGYQRKVAIAINLFLFLRELSLPSPVDSNAVIADMFRP
jgi:hypothetical protein